jgi:hypothetical protein
MKANHKKAIKISAIPAILVLLVIALYFIDRRYVKTGIIAICPKCLQTVEIKEITIFGWTHQSNKLEQRFDHKKISPKLYLEITGKNCNHQFIKGGFGATSGMGFFNGKAFFDGEYPQWSWYTPRIEAIEALYTAYVNTGNKELAQKTYKLIDAAFSLDYEKMYEAQEIIEFVNNQLMDIEKAYSYYPDAVSIAKAILKYKTVTPRLKKVQTDEQWRQLLSELENSPSIASQ